MLFGNRVPCRFLGSCLLKCFGSLVVLVFLLVVGFSCLEFFAFMASTEKWFLAIVCHAGAVLFLLFFFGSGESVPVHNSIPNCVYPFNTYTAGNVVVFIYYFSQTNLQQVFKWVSAD